MKTYVFYGFNIAIHILEQFKMRKTFTLPSYIPFLNLFISLSRSKFMVYVMYGLCNDCFYLGVKKARNAEWDDLYL